MSNRHKNPISNTILKHRNVHQGSYNTCQTKYLLINLQHLLPNQIYEFGHHVNFCIFLINVRKSQYHPFIISFKSTYLYENKTNSKFYIYMITFPMKIVYPLALFLFDFHVKIINHKPMPC